MSAWLSNTWPWYVAGPIIGSSFLLCCSSATESLAYPATCAIYAPQSCRASLSSSATTGKTSGLWNLVFLAGVLVGGVLAAHLGQHHAVAISPETREALTRLGIRTFSGVAPSELFSWQALLTWRGFISIVAGGFLVGFGTAYAGGCTSGHAISGLANFQLPSLIAVIGFFAGGLAATYFILPFVIGKL